ncbi:hypothetical protein [Clostridium tagluense]|uniref:hypothetical protein n=1 Tax=Clostridium tagluense TaxID=360422 RepID=UPI001C0E0144|nr:hypothetical protein [Clostridium tagluense]MBU3130171.1 hypothetical protein [Clostridium tagluense]
MGKLLYKLLPSLPMILPLSLILFIYPKIDEKYGITNKVSLKLKVSQEWKPFFCVCSFFVFILVVGILGIYIIEIPNTVYSILCGIYGGFSIGIANKLK